VGRFKSQRLLDYPRFKGLERSASIDDNGKCFIIRDHSGQALAYIRYEEEPGRRSAANLTSRDEARRIAVNFEEAGSRY
jgi:hypothetical protein